MTAKLRPWEIPFYCWGFQVLDLALRMENILATLESRQWFASKPGKPRFGTQCWHDTGGGSWHPTEIGLRPCALTCKYNGWPSLSVRLAYQGCNQWFWGLPADCILEASTCWNQAGWTLSIPRTWFVSSSASENPVLTCLGNHSGQENSAEYGQAHLKKVTQFPWPCSSVG